jgi:hypothetical protein
MRPSSVSRWGRIARDAAEAGIAEQQMAVALDPPAAAMTEFFDHIDERHGGTQAYLAPHGVCDREVDALRRALLP